MLRVLLLGLLVAGCSLSSKSAPAHTDAVDAGPDCADRRNEGLDCGTGVCHSGTCTPGCFIQGQFLSPGVEGFTWDASCTQCDPAVDRFHFSTRRADGDSCGSGCGTCHAGTCQPVCQPSDPNCVC